MIKNKKWRFFWIALSLLLLAVLALLVDPAFAQKLPNNQPEGAYRSAGPLHKVSVSDRQLVAGLQAQGGRIIADYGTFVLLEVNGAIADRLANSSSAQIVDENNVVMLNAGAIDTSVQKSIRGANAGRAGNQMRLIQFAGPVRSEWFRALKETGVRIVTYIPNNTYLVYGTPQALQVMQALASNKSMAQWDGDYTAAFRLDPAITRATTSKTPAQPNLSAQGNEQFTIQMVDDPAENKATLELIERLKLEPVIKRDSMLGYVNVTVALPRDAVIHQIAERADVVSIQRWSTPRLLDERQDIIMTGNITGSPAVPTPMDYLAYLTGKGFSLSTTASFAVNLSDTGVDNGTTTPTHFGLYRVGDPTVQANTRIIYNRFEPTTHVGGTLQGCDGHGNLNAHIIGGYVPTGGIFAAFPHADTSGFRWGLGLAPFVKIGSSVIFDPSFTSPVYKDLESQAYRDGARISSNSWGNTSGNTYTTDSQQYDALVRDAQPDTGCSGPNCISAPGNQEYVIVFAAGNSGSGANTVHAPATGKNVITVGAAENVSPFGGSDASGIGDTGANNANDIINFSSRGPTSDQRKKPDIMGPGTHVSGGVGQASIVSPTGSGTGAQNPCFNASGVSGGPSGSHFWPLAQQWWTASSGTSHSTPAAAGVAALMRQYFINQALTLPSPAMTKALMMNSARYMTGVGANDTLPSNNQGMGEINLNSFFDTFTTAHLFHDETAADLFTASGQQRVITGTVSDNSKPFRVTLAWTDVPGPTSGNAFVNNLDLEVTVGGNTYKGNVFSGAFSTTGGTADIRNNVESVFVPAGVTGSFTITVTATNIAGDGVPNNASPLDQDFALVAYNVGQASLAPNSAVSRKTHGGAGTFDVNLPLTGNVGIECRTGGATNDYSMVVTFASPVTVTGSPQAQVTSGTALIGTGGVSNGGAVSVAGAVVTIPLTSVANAQTITVKLSGVSDGTNVGDVSISMGMLIGDTGANGTVNASDVSQTKAQSGQAVGGGNFREDVNANGSISASDISLVKANSGTALP